METAPHQRSPKWLDGIGLCKGKLQNIRTLQG